MRRLLIALLLLAVAALGAAAAYVALPVARDLYAARALARSDPLEVDAREVVRVRERLTRAQARLDTIPARVLRRVPVLGTQMDAVSGVVDSAIPVVDAELALGEAIAGIREDGVLVDGAVDLTVVEHLAATLGATATALRDFEGELVRADEALLLPRATTGLGEVAARVRALRAGAEDGVELLGIVPPALGKEAPRTYLVLLLNNAELRGAGGILAGAGTVRVSKGRIELGRFYNIDDLRRSPYVTVPAPPEYVRRFATYKANTTLWVNATFSPDFPDVARVASRLFAEVTGVETDGVIGIDPRGLALAMPSAASVKVPGRAEPLTAETFPHFVYSESYGLYDDPDYRKELVIDAGLEAFRSILENSWDEQVELGRLAEAVAGGHLRVVSFHDREDAVLASRGATGDLAPVEGDSLMVVASNFGGGGGTGSKLDYWAERRIVHRCEVAGDGSGECLSRLQLDNTTPGGLVRYVAGRPYGLLRNFVEFYVPDTARITTVRSEGKPVPYWLDEQAGRTVVGVYLEVPRGRAATASVAYELAPGGDYRLLAVPQPLARDASVRIELQLPRDWRVKGPGSTRDGVHVIEGSFAAPIRIRAGGE